MLKDFGDGSFAKNLKMTVDPVTSRIWGRKERQIWMVALFFGCAMIYACRTVMPLTLPALAKEYHWTKSQSGTVLSAFFWGYTLTQILGGYMSDKTGGLFVIGSTAVGWSLTTFWTPMLIEVSSDATLNFYLIVASRVLIGASQGVFFPALSSILCQRVQETERASTFSGITSGTHAGTLLCGGLGSLLLSQFGWSSAFFAIGILAMGWLVIIRHFLIAKEKRKSIILSVKDMTSSVSNPEAVRPVPWLQFFKAVPFWAIIIGHYCMNNTFFILLSWLPTYFNENFPSAPNWIYNVAPWIVSIPATVMSGVLVDKLIARGFPVTLVRKSAAILALGGSACSLILLGYTSSFEAALVCMACAIGCCGFHASGILVNPQDIAPAYSGSVFGLMNTAGAVPGFIGVYIAGHILEVTNSWAMVFNATAVVAIFGCVVYVAFGTGKKIIN